jgi:phosphoribosyl-ATP pyrophosphohydrolase
VNDRVELIKEIADLQEILAALMNEKWIEPEEVKIVQEKRRQERGWFENKLFLGWTEE